MCMNNVLVETLFAPTVGHVYDDTYLCVVFKFQNNRVRLGQVKTLKKNL